MFDTAGADADAPKGENDKFVFADSRRLLLDTTSAVEPEPEGPGTEKVVDPKADPEEACPCPPNAEDDDDDEAPPPNAELAPKARLPNTFVVLRFANADAAGATEVGAAVSGVGTEDPKAERGAGTGDVPKAEVDDELAPKMAEGEGLTPNVPVSHSVALGFSGCGWC